jgi:hypothetical protein
MPLTEIAPVEGVTGTRLKVARGDYSFAVDGGAQGTIALMGATLIPTGAIIVGGYIEVTTQLTSGGSATIACQVNAANDILTAVAVASWTAGRKNILPAMTTGALTASTAVKTTAARDISIVIATADLTAGVFKVVLFYHDPQTP